MIELGHLAQLVMRGAMIEHIDAVEVRSGLGGKFADLFFVADDRDLCNSVADARGRGLNGAEIVALRQYYVLRVGRGSLTNGFEDHERIEFSIQRNDAKLAQSTRLSLD